jgi:hypothetical protein
MMERDQPTEPTPSERAQLDALPRERLPGRLLEERTVRALRARGLLRPPRFRASWVAAAIAASVALFAGGFASGQWVNSRQVTSSLLAAQDQTAMRAAQTVQQTGSAYVAALIALSQYADSTGNSGVQQGREAALAILSAAASELAGLTPADPMAAALRAVLLDAESARRDESARNVLWF